MNNRRLVANLAAAAFTFAAVASIVITTFFLSSSSSPQVQRITNGSQHQRLAFQTSDEYPSGVTLRVHGHIDGTATISTIEDRWPPHQVSGDVDWFVYHDWFDSTCTFDYTPARGASGQLTFELTFH